MGELKGRVPSWSLDIELAQQDKSNYRHYCTCKHPMLIPEYKNFEICPVCGNKVYTKKGLKMLLTKTS